MQDGGQEEPIFVDFSGPGALARRDPDAEAALTAATVQAALAAQAAHVTNGGESEDSSSFGASMDSIFAGSENKLHHGSLTPALAFAILVKRSDEQTVGTMLLFDNTDDPGQGTFLAAVDVSGENSTLVRVKKLGHNWVLEDEDFAQQRFPSLIELAFFYTVRSLRNLHPVERLRESEQLTDDELLRGTLTTSRTGIRPSSVPRHRAASVDSTLSPRPTTSPERWATARPRSATTTATATSTSTSPSSPVTSPAVREAPIQEVQQEETHGTAQVVPDVGHIEYTFHRHAEPSTEQHGEDAAATTVTGQPCQSQVSTESAIEQQSRAIVMEDMAGRGSQVWVEVDESDSCCSLCCTPVLESCSCLRKSDDNIWYKCVAAAKLFCMKRCFSCSCDPWGCGCGDDEADSHGNLHHSIWKALCLCCCYVDRTERPFYTTRRRGLLPLLLIVLGHILFGFVILLVLSGKFFFDGMKYLFRRWDQCIQ